MKKLMLGFCILISVFILSGLALADDAVVAETVPGADLVATLLACLPVSWEGWATLVVTVCAAISAIWPRPKEDAPLLWRALYTVVNALGFNAGKAKNADDANAIAARLR